MFDSLFLEQTPPSTFSRTNIYPAKKKCFCFKRKPKGSKCVSATHGSFLACVLHGKKASGSPGHCSIFSAKSTNQCSQRAQRNPGAEPNQAPFVQASLTILRIFDADVNFLNYKSFLSIRNLLISSQRAWLISQTVPEGCGWCLSLRVPAAHAPRAALLGQSSLPHTRDRTPMPGHSLSPPLTLCPPHCHPQPCCCWSPPPSHHCWLSSGSRSITSDGMAEGETA